MDGTCGSGRLAGFLLLFFCKNHDSVERTTQGFRFNSQNEVEANNT
jgi:hypothetical protein